MTQIKFYNSKKRHLLSSILWTLFSIPFFLNVIQNNFTYVDIIVLTFLNLLLIYDLYKLTNSKPEIVLDCNALNFPLKNESLLWDNVSKVEFNSVGNVTESIDIRVKEIDLKRKKSNLIRVYYDYDDTGELDYSLYRVELEKLKIENEQFCKFILDLSRKNRAEREILINAK